MRRKHTICRSTKGKEVSSVGRTKEIDLDLLRSGDHTAFEIIVNTYYNYVYRLCYRMLGNASDAEDVTQDTFLRIHRSIRNFHGESTMSTWIYRIAHNACLDEIRRKKRRPLVYFSTQEEAEQALDVSDMSAGPEEQACSAEDLHAMRAVLAELPVEFRSILVLREIEDLSYEQIANVLDCPIGTVRSRLARARRMLSEKLRGRVQNDMPHDTRAPASS